MPNWPIGGSEFAKVVRDYLEEPDSFTTCTSGCNICADIKRFRKITKEVGAGQRLAPDFMEKIKHPLLKEALIRAICLRAADSKVPDNE
jgi:hypothetical protein